MNSVCHRDINYVQNGLISLSNLLFDRQNRVTCFMGQGACFFLLN